MRKVIQYHTAGSKTDQGNGKRNKIAAFLFLLSLICLFFAQQVYQLNFVNLTDIPCSNEKKCHAKEQQCHKHGIRIKTKPKCPYTSNRSQNKSRHHSGQHHTKNTACKHCRNTKNKSFTKKLSCYRPLFHAENHINRKFAAALLQHISTDIADQRNKNDRNCQYCIPDCVLKQSQRIISVSSQNIVIPARQGEKRKEQCTADNKGKEIDHIVL